jgi:hypothetical protein
MNSIRAKIREATGRHNMGVSLESVVAKLNQVLRRWAATATRAELNPYRWSEVAQVGPNSTQVSGCMRVVLVGATQLRAVHDTHDDHLV